VSEQPEQAEPVADEPAPPEPVTAGGALDLVAVRRQWPLVLEEVKTLRRFTWTLLSHNAQVAALGGTRITLAMVNAGARDSFLRGGSDEIVREALVRVLGVDWKVDAIVDPSTTPVPAAASAPAAAPAPSGRAAAEAAVAAEAAEEAAGPRVEDTPSVDDDDADDGDLTHHDLLARELGAKVIGEYDAS
jgi:DNA polymerase-3 subunit gamma/tau